MPDMDVRLFVEEQVKVVRKALGKEKALIAVSGGVDSTVSAAITHKAIGDNLVCAFIDDGFMRLGEPEKVKAVLSAPPLGLQVKVFDVKERFMKALKGLMDAEEKRVAFRDAFYTTLSEAAKGEACKFLVQGTIKADVIETKGGVKTQHNVLEQVGINPVDRFGFKVIEPVLSLYKYQVREVARFLGAPPELAERQPFPGPGLSVRVVGEITEEKLAELKKATIAVEDVFRAYKPDQYFAAIFKGDVSAAPEALGEEASRSLKLRSSKVEASYFVEKATGVIEGKRTYGQVAVLGVPGDAREADYAALEAMRVLIQRKHPEVTRVLFRVGGRGGSGYAMAMRAVKTRDFITADIAHVPWKALKEASGRILADCPKVATVYVDVTPKPPATIEFE